MFEQVSTGLGQPIIVENRVGAGNTIAMAAVARAEPDGYTLLINSSTHTLVPVTYANLPFDALRDLAPVIPLGNMPLVFVVSASKGYMNVAGLPRRSEGKAWSDELRFRRDRQHHAFPSRSIPARRRI